jgi:hypothetical protein
MVEVADNFINSRDAINDNKGRYTLALIKLIKYYFKITNQNLLSFTKDQFATSYYCVWWFSSV